MKIVLPGELTDQNTYIKAERSNRHAAAAIKETETTRVYYETLNKYPGVEKYPVDLTFTWYCKNRMKDPDNISFSIKFILDGLQMSKIIKDDRWKQINSIKHLFRIDKSNPRVEILIDYSGEQDDH